MKYDPTLWPLITNTASMQLQDRIEEISLATRATLLDAAEKLRTEITTCNETRNDSLIRIAEMLERLAYGESDDSFGDTDYGSLGRMRQIAR